MKIVAVTACPTGIAHTYMAAERLERAARKLGHTIKVETQGAMGIENALTAADVKGADVVILAAGIAIRDRERFEGLRVVEVVVQDAIRNAEGVLASLGKLRTRRARRDRLRLSRSRAASTLARRAGCRRRSSGSGRR